MTCSSMRGVATGSLSCRFIEFAEKAGFLYVGNAVKDAFTVCAGFFTNNIVHHPPESEFTAVNPLKISGIRVRQSENCKFFIGNPGFNGHLNLLSDFRLLQPEHQVISSRIEANCQNKQYGRKFFHVQC